MNFNTNHYVPQYPQLKFQGRGCPQQSQYGRGLVRGGCYGGRHQCFGAAREQSFATATATSSRLPAGAAQPLGCLQGTTGDAPSAQLFISNIPSRVREEEIVRLFRPFPGFLSGRLRRTKMNNYIAFVEFDSAEHSGHARDILNGYNFDTKTVPPNNTAYTRQELKYFGITIDFSRPQQQQQQQQQQHFQLYHFPPAARQPPQQQLPPSLQPSLLTVDTGYDGNSSINGSNVYDENNNDDDDDDDEDNVVSNNDNNGGTFQSHFILYTLDSPCTLPTERVSPKPETESSTTLYVEGLPQDCTKREAAHIFRRFSGFRDLRIIPKEDRFTKSTFLLCFVDFESREDATAALTSIQDYKMDLDHLEERGLTVFFARSNKKN